MTSSKRDKIIAFLNKHPGRPTPSNIAKALRCGIKADEIRSVADEIGYAFSRDLSPGRPPVIRTEKRRSGTINSRPVSEVVEEKRLDHAKLVRDALREMAEQERETGEPQIISSDDLRRHLELGVDAWKEVSADPEFDGAKAIIRKTKTVYYGTPKGIAAFCQTTGVQPFTD